MPADERQKTQDRIWSQWMVAGQDGDQAAYARLLTDVRPFILVLARRRCLDPARCEDIVQDVLLTVHRIRHTYDPARPFTPWLAAICERRSVDALRRRGRLNTHEVDDQITYETFADPSANKDLDARDASEALAALIADLPPGQRQALELLKLKEMSLVEASQASGQSIASLKVGVHRALKALRLKVGST